MLAIPAVLAAALSLAVVFSAAVMITALSAAGILLIPSGAMLMAGIGHIAAEIPPAAIMLLGGFAISFAGVIAVTLYLVCPKLARTFSKCCEWFRLN